MKLTANILLLSHRIHSYVLQRIAMTQIMKIVNESVTLKDIVEYLKSNEIILSKSSSDGRINSIKNEDEILKIIEKKFSIEIPQAREWADFFISDIPVNIKITTTKTADNASSKKGLFYALTGNIYTGGNDWETYLKTLKENIKQTPNDYYFLIINKEKHKDIFLNSLKSIRTFQPNGNNLPFQIKWCENREPQQRNFEESKQLLLRVLGKSIKLRADAYISFQKYFNEYLT